MIADCFDSFGSSERFLVVAAVFADVAEDVQAEFSDVEAALCYAVLDDLQQRPNQPLLQQILLKILESTSCQQRQQNRPSPRFI